MIESRLKKNPRFTEATASENPRYFLELAVILAGLGNTVTVNVPLYWQPKAVPNSSMKEIYSAEIAGVAMAKGNLESLRESVEDVVWSLIRYGLLPSYFIVIKDGEEDDVPVYRVNGGLQARPHGAPQFNGHDIGQLATFVKEYFALARNSRHVASVAMLSLQDLRLYRPLFVLLAEDDHGAWIPVFREYGKTGQAMAEWERQTFPRSEGKVGGLSITELWWEVASWLTQMGKLTSPYDLYIGDLLPDLWQLLRGFLKPTGFALHTAREVGEKDLKLMVPIYQNGHDLLLAYLPLQGGLLHFGPDPEEVRRRVSWDLEARGAIPRADVLTLGSAIIQSS